MFKFNHRNILNFALNKLSHSNTLFTLQSRNFTTAKPVFSHEFKSKRTGIKLQLNNYLHNVGESNRSQRGIWQGKQHGSGCVKSFSMKQYYI
jgi:hypothetical protein